VVYQKHREKKAHRCSIFCKHHFMLSIYYPMKIEWIDPILYCLMQHISIMMMMMFWGYLIVQLKTVELETQYGLIDSQRSDWLRGTMQLLMHRISADDNDFNGIHSSQRYVCDINFTSYNMKNMMKWRKTVWNNNEILITLPYRLCYYKIIVIKLNWKWKFLWCEHHL
jgi:hypothetical protein